MRRSWVQNCISVALTAGRSRRNAGESTKDEQRMAKIGGSQASSAFRSTNVSCSGAMPTYVASAARQSLGTAVSTHDRTYMLA
jgi:hypothetical protein